MNLFARPSESTIAKVLLVEVALATVAFAYAMPNVGPWVLAESCAAFFFVYCMLAKYVAEAASKLESFNPYW